MTSTKLLETPAVAQAVIGSIPCCVVDDRDRITEVNAAFAARINRPAQHLVGIQILELMRGLAVDESRSTGANCFHIREAGKESWLRLDRTQVAPAREVIRLVDVSSEWHALTSVVTARTTAFGTMVRLPVAWAAGSSKLNELANCPSPSERRIFVTVMPRDFPAVPMRSSAAPSGDLSSINRLFILR